MNRSPRDALHVVDNETRLSMPIAIVLERFIDPSKKWSYPTWRVHGLLTGDAIPGDKAGSVVDIDEHTRRSTHTGFTLDLFRDGSEGYWYNLLSEQPYLFVICEGDYSSREIRPMLVTANQDEANGHLESDDVVLSAPMPAEITQLLERYVIAHYKPEVKRKRKRRDWVEDSLYTDDGPATTNKAHQ